MGTPRSIETRNQIDARMALQWNKTKDETAFGKRFTRKTRIEDGSCGSLQTIEIGSDFGSPSHLMIHDRKLAQESAI